MNLVAFLVGMVGPLAAQLIVSLGVSLITLTGLTVAVGALKTQVINNLSGLPLAGLQLAGLYGAWTALGMVFGCITFVLTWRSTKGFTAIAKK